MFLNLVLYEFPASFLIRRVGDWESQPMPFNWGGFYPVMPFFMGGQMSGMTYVRTAGRVSKSRWEKLFLGPGNHQKVVNISL